MKDVSSSRRVADRGRRVSRDSSPTVSRRALACPRPRPSLPPAPPPPVSLAQFTFVLKSMNSTASFFGDPVMTQEQVRAVVFRFTLSPRFGARACGSCRVVTRGPRVTIETPPIEIVSDVPRTVPPRRVVAVVIFFPQAHSRFRLLLSSRDLVCVRRTGPARRQIEQLTDEVFKEFDKDGAGEIGFSMCVQFAAENVLVQSFINGKGTVRFGSSR